MRTGTQSATKALPNRQPERAAQKHATRMMTHGGAALPVRTIQQSGAFCPSCGEHHRPGKTCGVKALGDFMDLVKAAGGVVMSSNTHGNRAHDPATGRFTSAPQGGGGGGAPTAAGKAPAAAPKDTTPGMNTAAAPPAGATVPDRGTAVGAGPAPPSAPAGGEQKTGVGIAPGRAKANQARRADMQQAASDKQDADIAGLSSALRGEHDPRAAGEAAYFKHRDEALAGGASEGEAHEVGKKHAMQAWDAAQAKRDAAKQVAGGTPGGAKTGVGPRVSSDPALAPTQGAGTAVSAPPRPTSIPLSTTPGVPAPGTTTPGAPATPGAPTTAPGAQPGTPPLPAKPDAQGKKGKDGAGGFNPWSMYGIGSSIGGGVYSPGGSFAPTAHGAVHTAHSLLSGGPQQRPPAAVERNQSLQSIAKPPKAPKRSAAGASSQQQVSP